MKENIMIGIPGSGKSTFIKHNFLDSEVICPDEIRKELTGDISDQSKNVEVWNEVFNRIKEFSKLDKDIVIDATNISIKTINSLIKEAGDNLSDIDFYIMEDSYTWHDCLERVRRQLAKGEVRSDVDILIDDPKNEGKKIHLVKSMYKRFKFLMENQFDNYINELSKKYRINIKHIKDGELF